MVFLWGKKVINLGVVEGTPFSGAAPEGWVFLKAYVPERLPMASSWERSRRSLQGSDKVQEQMTHGLSPS